MASPICIATFNIFYVLLLIFLGTSIIIAIYKLYKSQQQTEQTGQNSNRGGKTLYYLGLFFFVAIVMWFMAAITLNSLWCFDSMTTFYHDMYGASGSVYLLQFTLLLLILFMRLQLIFKATSFALSRRIILLFWCLFIIFILAGVIIVVAMIVAPGGVVYLIVYPLNGALSMFLVFLLVFLYVYKLYSVSTHHDSEQNDTIVSSITKATILTLISLSSTILFMVYAVLVPHKEGMSDLLALASNALVLCDVYTNAAAIALSFKSFNKEYVKMCGFCHKRVSNMFNSSIAVRQLQSATSHDPSTDDKHIGSQLPLPSQTSATNDVTKTDVSSATIKCIEA